MKSARFFLLTTTFAAGLAAVAHAQTQPVSFTSASALSGRQVLDNFINMIINPALLLIFAAGFFLFVWGLVQFIRNLNEGNNRQEGVQHMLWGIVGMVVMVSVKGILIILINTFSLGITLN